MTGYHSGNFVKWADITLYNVGRADYDKDEEPDITWRVGPETAQNLKQRLADKK